MKIYDWDLATLNPTVLNNESEPFFNSLLQGEFCQDYGICNKKLDRFDLFTIMYYFKRFINKYNIINDLINNVFINPQILNKKYGFFGRLCNLVSKLEKQYGYVGKLANLIKKSKEECNGPYDPIVITSQMKSSYQTLLTFTEFQYFTNNKNTPREIYSIQTWPLEY